jgi:hypothetical protein
MKSKIIDAIADLTLQATPDLATRLEYQEEALRDVQCTNPVIGAWIDANDVEYLLSTFDLNDQDFAARFPAMAHSTKSVRQRLIATIEAHCERCQHCSLKRGYDLELDARIEQAGQDNRQSILGLIKEENDSDGLESEGEHRGDVNFKVSSA